MEPRNQFENHFAGASIEIAGGLIRQKDSRLGDESSRQCQALLLSARKFT
jgi:hypothetical protein